MSKLIVEEVEKGEFQGGDLQDVTFLYVCVNEPKLKYESDNEKEFSVKCVVDQDTSAEWERQFKKNKPTLVPTSEFEGKFKIKPPYPDQDNQHILLVKVAAQDDSGNPYAMSDFKRPHVFTPSSNGVKDITTSTLVANGSKGDVYFWVSNNKFGSFPMLKEMLVRELIVYEARDNGSNSRWGSVENAEGSPDAEASSRFSEQEKETAPQMLEDGSVENF